MAVNPYDTNYDEEGLYTEDELFSPDEGTPMLANADRYDLGLHLNKQIEELCDKLKVSAGYCLEDNRLAGRLHHRTMAHCSTTTVEQYLTMFIHQLTTCVGEFISDHITELEHICAQYQHSEEYERLLNGGILPAKRLFDTYVLKNEALNMYENPVHMFLRIAAFCASECEATPCLKQTVQYLMNTQNPDSMLVLKYFFEAISSQLICCATPIMRSAGVVNGNLASCYILNPTLDCEKATMNMFTQELMPLLLAQSGVGISVTKFSQGAKSIHGLLNLLNSSVEFLNDRNVRPVSVAAYMELWHFQIQEFLVVKLPETPNRCGSIFQGVCIPELFFKLYNDNPMNMWYLFDPKVAYMLPDLYGEKFNQCYYQLISQGKAASCVTCKSIMFTLISTMIKTGTPYILYKEAMNEHHWYEPQGQAINCANLCAEIIQSPHNVTSVCNLANICLPRCLEVDSEVSPCENPFKPLYKNKHWKFSFQKLKHAVEVATMVVNCAIMGGTHASPGVARGQQDRSMGLGVQGLSDVFAILGHTYCDPASEELDTAIFEHMYYHAVKTSHAIVRRGNGAPYQGWEQSKLAAGEFHWESWKDVKPTIHMELWNDLRHEIQKCGTFNCQFIALMPTAGTSQVTGHSESFYPNYGNVVSHVSNKEEIMRSNMVFFESVDPADIRDVRASGGNVGEMSVELSKKYERFKTAFDYNPYEQIRRARARAPFIDQSQSFSLFLKETHVQKASFLKDLILFGAQQGLKTLVYYCRIQKCANLASLECLSKPGLFSHREAKEEESTANVMLSNAKILRAQGTKGEDLATAPQCNLSEYCVHCE